MFVLSVDRNILDKKKNNNKKKKIDGRPIV